MNEILILSAAPEKDLIYIRALYQSLGHPVVICADGGTSKAQVLGIPWDLMIGDQDSGGVSLGAAITLPAEKDFSDTEACVEEAIRRGCRSIYIAGAIGGRLDHTAFNLLLVAECAARGVDCQLWSADNIVQYAQTGSYKVPTGFPYVSLVPLDRYLTGVTIQGVKYPLQKAQVRRGSTLTLSNEPLDREIQLEIESGQALLIFSRDHTSCL